MMRARYAFGGGGMADLCLVLFGAIACVLPAIVLICLFDVPAGDLTRDPASLAHMPPYAGYLSQLGVMLWAAAVGVGVLVAHLLRRATSAEGVRWYRFFSRATVLTALMAIDDTFMLHEFVLPRCGIPQMLVLVLYGGLAVAFLLVSRKVVCRHGCPLLLVTALGFGLSLGLDVLLPSDVHLYLLEDGAKLLGQLSWVSYMLSVSLQVSDALGLRARPEEA